MSANRVRRGDILPQFLLSTASETHSRLSTFGKFTRRRMSPFRVTYRDILRNKTHLSGINFSDQKVDRRVLFTQHSNLKYDSIRQFAFYIADKKYLVFMRNMWVIIIHFTEVMYSNVQDDGRNDLWSSIENTNEKIFREKFEKQQKNLLNLITGNFDITMTEIKKVQSDINELNKSKSRAYRDSAGRKSC